MSSKSCFKCLKVKPIEEFYRHKGMSDGHLGKCKECAKTDVSKNYDANFLKKREYEAARYKRPERRLQIAARQKKARTTSPEKYRARTAVGNAVRDGRIQRLPCKKCGNLKSQAHHHDYSKPLDVEWLCFKCHRLEHGQSNVTK
jgi:hypothetical protein